MENNKEIQDNCQSLQMAVSVSVTDLRVGNLVSVGKNALHYQIDCEQIFEIEEIKKDTVHFKGFFAGEYFKDLKPIPITEEWLLKFGCIGNEINPKKKNYWNQQLDFSIDIEFSWNESFFYYLVYNQKRRKNISYVHQLQNLYFALTGLELQCGNLTEH